MSSLSDVVIRAEDLYLNGISSFGQYVVDGHLVIIIGEAHKSDHGECSAGLAISVPQYIREKARQGFKILFEYEPGQARTIELLGSFNLKESYKAINADGREGQVVGFDLRRKYLAGRDQDVLFHQPVLFATLDAETVVGVFINVIRARIIPELWPVVNDPGQRAYLESFLIDLGKHADAVVNEVMHKWKAVKPDAIDETQAEKVIPGPTQWLIHDIRHLWSKVSDYIIVLAVFDLAPKSPLVILCGEEHAKNLKSIFKDLKQFYGAASGKNECINLKGAIIRT